MLQAGAAMESFDLGQYAAALEQYFASLEGVVLAYLFGSHATGRAWAQSDVDVAVLLEGRPDDDRCFDMRLEVIGGLMGILHTNDVDVLILNQAPPALRYAVLRDGILLFCRDRQAMIEFRVRALNEYLDFKPILKRHGDAILEKARRGKLLSGYDPYKDTLERYRRLRERLAETTPADV
jgi:predicted nucleotidyltransferase